MFFPDYEVVRRLMRERVQQHLQATEAERLLQQACAGQRGWLARQVCRALSGLGRALVALGQQLQRYEVVLETSAGE